MIKASGLAEGKGVVIASTEDEARQAVREIMVGKRFGAAGDTVVIEDFMSGQEISAHALCDDRSAVLFPAAQDHKQIYDGDVGANTGGMGVVAPVPWVTAGHLDAIATGIVERTLEGLRQEGANFIGCLYPGLMVQGESVKVVEFNARFGDPEAQTYMRLLDGDLFEVLDACAKGQLATVSLAWRPGTAISVALVSEGYPASYKKGLEISGLEEAASVPGVVVFHGGTLRDEGGLRTAGGRVLYVTAHGADIEEARARAYEAVKLINFEGASYRSDIGLRLPPEQAGETTA